jgi:hypothetical protein
MDQDFQVIDHRTGIHIPGAYEGTFSAKEAGADDFVHRLQFSASQQQVHQPEIHTVVRSRAGSAATSAEKTGIKAGYLFRQDIDKASVVTIERDQV